MEFASPGLLQTLLMSAAAFLTMLGCGLGDTLMQMAAPQNDFMIEAAQPPVDSAMAFIEALTDGNYLGASQYLCPEAQPGFFSSDPSENILLGADISHLTASVATTGTDGILTFTGEVILDPGTPSEFPIPADLFLYQDVPMVMQNGQWLLCPPELIND